jgi:hypothetical protein
MQKKVAFPLTRPTLNFSSDSRNFINPLKKKSNLFKNIEHIFVIATNAKVWAVLHVYRGYMDTGIKPLFNSMKILMSVLEFAMYSLELEIKFKKKNNINLFPTYLPYFFSQR